MCLVGRSLTFKVIMNGVVNKNSLLFFTILIALKCCTAHDSIMKFPENFQFGIASSAYQVEGAWKVADKGESIWDRFTHKKHNNIPLGATGDEACDSYHFYKRDVEMLEELGVQYYRFSISWPRLLPDGFIYKTSKDGLRYYNNLIDALLAKNITPLVTIYHWDLPQKLQDFGGWVNPLIVDYFEDYARYVFEQFGDRVKNWISINEPILFCHQAYGTYLNYAPDWSYPGVADYRCGHNALLAHARVWHLYNNVFRQKQKGRVGITLYTPWVEPKSDSKEDKDAAERGLEFLLGIYANPIFSTSGDYPKVVKDDIGKRSFEQGFPKSRLPQFTQDEIRYIRGASDFFGFNFYTSIIYNRNTTSEFEIPSMEDDVGYEVEIDPSWPTTAADWFYVNPPGFRKMLNWIKNKYNSPEIIITENGFPTTKGIMDYDRAKYLQTHLHQLFHAIEDGCNITAYTVWSLMESFEWSHGYEINFGLYEVDFKSLNKTRRKRYSALIYEQIARTKTLDSNFKPDAKALSSASNIQLSISLLLSLLMLKNASFF